VTSRSPAPQRRIGVIGLGYVGLPVAAAFARVFDRVVGFDIDATRVAELRKGVDRTKEVHPNNLTRESLHITADEADLADVDFFIVTVPTPIDADHRPDLGAMKAASRTVGRALKPGGIVVYESTVYPGVTEDICGPILAEVSGLEAGVDFKLGYSPERINPGDKEHTFEKITKVVSGEDAETLEIVADTYGAVVRAGIHRAPSIKVAEAAKVIENTQRDLNIALMNELSVIFDRMDIDTLDVLAAAGTKWNFLKFTPGLVGGHCIGVDPYYLTSAAEQRGVHPEVILAGRRINDSMGSFVAQKTIKLLIHAGVAVNTARVAVLGVTFKENIPDIRNSRVPFIIRELQDYGVEVLTADPHADPAEFEAEYGLPMRPLEHVLDVDAVVFAVPHYGLSERVRELAGQERTKVVVDIKGVLAEGSLPGGVKGWRL
jgi:UDP-N-acetyl-D-galactosamine dehydrogenase